MIKRIATTLFLVLALFCAAVQPQGLAPTPGGLHGGGGCAGFPCTPVLDNFNRANTGPPPSGNWSSPIISGEVGLQVISNQLASGSTAASSSYWSASTFGPDVEVYGTYSATPERPELFARLTNPGTGTCNGYAVFLNANGGNTLRVYRIDNGAHTQLGADISQTISSGDSFGMSIVGSTITVYYKVGAGAWTSLGTRSDATYSGAGNIGARAVDNTLAPFLDDFGGGTH